MNECRSCGEVFSSVTNFDRHRVGVHDYDYSTEKPDGRRCLDVDEIQALGLVLNEKARWSDPAASQRMREVFAKAA